VVRSIFISLLFFIFSAAPLLAQEEIKNDSITTIENVVASSNYVIDPLAPSKAAFYSAVVPGLGQVYNKSYWKVPIVYGSMGLSLYYYSFNNTKYHEYRNAYRDRLAGREVTGELAPLSEDRLISGQRFHQRNRDLSLLITVGLYVLNVVEANVDAHLAQFNVNENLSFRPAFEQNSVDYNYHMGLTLSYQF
jgi:hypothetical protein